MLVYGQSTIYVCLCVCVKFLRDIPEVAPWDGLDNDEDGLSCEPNEGEFRIAINWMKNAKAPREDMITADLLKLGGDTIVKWLSNKAPCIWSAERVAEDWLKYMTVPVHKKRA